VDIEGQGEILRITALPTPGTRRFAMSSAGLISDVDFVRIPRPYTITRTGYRPRLVALTFDDGPDEHWTPRILDILKAKQVPATFFVVGENALTERGLLQREVREGHEVGSHTYTHPNLATADETRTLFELNATQRLFQAFTGRTLKLFRAPFFGDAEPTTADEILPVWEAQNRGYVSVGLHVDSEDWQRPGVAAIVNNVVTRVLSAPPTCDDQSDAQCSRNIVLLHDSGGDRSQTVAALPIIIDTLRARGYRFVAVSELAGLSPIQAMPPLSRSDHLAARIDLGLFELLGFSSRALGFLFAAAITLGIARALFLSGFALVAAWKEMRRKAPPIAGDSFVSVLIPAYNEERVIERAVSQVLASRNVRLEVIVIDDGSKDRTSEIVRTTFRGDPRVQLLTLENGGKARALNHGLALAKSEIVIALDADTQFDPDTIARLVRWFAADERLAAVAGNAKVGNRVNLVTKWQALEYVTAQNLERRALARLGAMTVVPGAVGAWRRAAIAEVGGYPPETLAEDQDLTIAVQRAGWSVTYDQSAIAWTEAPQSFRQLARQRFRWAFGTIQCVWKHKRIMADGRPRGLAFLGLPQTILFQLLFALVSPIIDLALLLNVFWTVSSIHEHGYTAVKGDLHRVALFWIIFAAIDLTAGLIAFALERRENWRLIGWLLPQRFGYRQIMYYVVIKAVVQALRGPRVGWSSIARSGQVAVRAPAP
jgi:cellulose synthase/poly-beta-1,6-N-acetylglucosamine synthase-like glycosyltransferase/peptidoglycan/xylan/chitin deacetylase (PgdA/CDA1 family)